MKLEEKRKSLRIIIKRKKIMRTRQEAVEFGLTFKDTYVETPFRDANWQLVRVKKSKKAFLWIYERDGYSGPYSSSRCECKCIGRFCSHCGKGSKFIFIFVSWLS